MAPEHFETFSFLIRMFVSRGRHVPRSLPDYVYGTSMWCFPLVKNFRKYFRILGMRENISDKFSFYGILFSGLKKLLVLFY
jgi:hypothetical protein